jgi:hypothetical protein
MRRAVGCWVATRDVFSPEELAQLRGFPEIDRAALIRHFTVTGPDEVFLRKYRGARNVLGVAVQLCTLPWLGFVPDDVTGVRGMDRLRAAWAVRRERLPRDHGHLALMDASMTYLRQFAPAVLAAVRFAGGPGTEQLLAAVATLTELYATGARKVPPDAPAGFVPARWAGYLATAGEAGDTTAYRHYWELCVLVGLRDGLRSGDVFVPGSRLGAAALRRGGRIVDEEVLAHIWPTHHENVHFYGTHSVDIDDELAQLDADGSRPLRPPAV